MDNIFTDPESKNKLRKFMYVCMFMCICLYICACTHHVFLHRPIHMRQGNLNTNLLPNSLVYCLSLLSRLWHYTFNKYHFFLEDICIIWKVKKEERRKTDRARERGLLPTGYSPAVHNRYTWARLEPEAWQSCQPSNMRDSASKTWGNIYCLRRHNLRSLIHKRNS